MNKQKLELRMYGFVAYNLGSVQKGIQFGHAVVEYSKFIDQLRELGIPEHKEVVERWIDWRDNHKTFIVLDGGSTNKNLGPNLGNLNLLYSEISVLTPTIPFYEPDLGDQMSAFVFILDERVFNEKDWSFYYEDKDFIDIKNKWFEQLPEKEQIALESLRHLIKGKRLAQ